MDEGILQLIDGAIAGDLSDEERRVLRRALDSDPAVGSELLEQQATAQALGVLLGDPAGNRRVVRSVLADLRGTAPAAFRAGVKRALAAAPGRGGAGARPRRRLAAARPRGYRVWRWVTGLAAAVLIALGALVRWQSDLLGRRWGAGAVATVRQVSGEVYRLSAEHRVPVKAGERVDIGQTIVTGARASAVTLARQDGSAFELAAATTFAFRQSEADPAPVAFTESGLIRAVITPRPPAEPVRLGTPHAAIRVIGTRLEVRVQAEASRIAVSEGVVEVTNLRDGATERVAAGCVCMAGNRLVVEWPAGARTRRGLVALYTFAEGRGRFVRDVAGMGPALDLEIPEPGAVAWLQPAGLAVRAPTLIASVRPAEKIARACAASDEITIEAWIRPANITQGRVWERMPARIATMSASASRRNFELGQNLNTITVRLRTGPDHEKCLWTPYGSLHPQLTHVVVTRRHSGEVSFWIDGVRAQVGTYDEAGTRFVPHGGEPGRFGAWDAGMRLALANEFGADRAWLGEYHLLAVYSRALDESEIRQNRAAGLALQDRRTALPPP
ncbi:MAG: FecR domain-containing protein [Kiritimatiellae bacterium]|nr:FecR domain-containing protein [Kiritimatiellia bacterium]